MNHSVKTGFSFGFTSAIITTLGLMVGLNAGTHSRLVVLGGILTIAIADAFSDALEYTFPKNQRTSTSPKRFGFPQVPHSLPSCPLP